MKDKWTISISSENAYILDSLEKTFSAAAEFQVVNVTNSGDVLMKCLQLRQPDIIIADFSVNTVDRNLTGFTNLTILRKKYPDIKVIVLTSLKNAGIFKMLLEHGAMAVISKNDPVKETEKACFTVMEQKKIYLSPGIQTILDNSDNSPKSSMLTAKELEVVRLFASGYTLSQIADRQNRTISTVSTQKWSAMRRLGITTNSELIRYAFSQGIIV